MDIVNGIDRRNENDKIAKEAEENSKEKSIYDEINEKKRSELNRRRIFISL